MSWYVAAALASVFCAAMFTGFNLDRGVRPVVTFVLALAVYATAYFLFFAIIHYFL